MLTDVDALMATGQVHDAISTLTERHRATPEAQIEEQLVKLRHNGFASIEHDPRAQFRPIVSAGTGGTSLPELDSKDLRAEALRDAFARRGCAVVRGLIPRHRATDLAGKVDRALDAFDAGLAGSPAAETTPWFSRFRPSSDQHRLGSRQFVRASGGMWAADSPRMLLELCDLLDSSGVGRLATDFLGERPALSALKCNLRRVPVDTNSNWHQDGAFLGTEVRSVNLWLALSDCGEDAPGLDIVPRRFDEILPTGTDGAIFDWSVSPDIVEEMAASTPVVRPRFAAGDALLFDHMFLHRTGVDSTMSLERYAIECWMFAPSMYPSDQIPLVY